MFTFIFPDFSIELGTYLAINKCLWNEWKANLNISEPPNPTYYLQGSAHMSSLPPPTLSNSYNILTVFLLWHLSFSISDYSYLCIYLHFPNKVKLSETKAISRSPPKSYNNTQLIKVLNKCLWNKHIIHIHGYIKAISTVLYI